MNITAIDPGHTVHELDGTTTLCGLDATGWDRRVTAEQQAGLRDYCFWCEMVYAVKRSAL
jgi:hypothetical protein